MPSMVLNSGQSQGASLCVCVCGGCMARKLPEKKRRRADVGALKPTPGFMGVGS